jgi:predicted nuclease of predicted toxin-antitoxin system
VTKLKVDENLSVQLKSALSRLGYNVETARDEGLLGQSDTEIASAAGKGDRVLLTLDLEFGDLRKHPPGNHPGIVLFRPRSFGPLAVNHFVEGFLKSIDLMDFPGCIIIVDPSKVRVRRPQSG